MGKRLSLILLGLLVVVLIYQITIHPYILKDVVNIFSLSAIKIVLENIIGLSILYYYILIPLLLATIIYGYVIAGKMGMEKTLKIGLSSSLICGAILGFIILLLTLGNITKSNGEGFGGIGTSIALGGIPILISLSLLLGIIIIMPGLIVGIILSKFIKI